MLRAFWSSEKIFKKALTNKKTYDIIKVQKKGEKMLEEILFFILIALVASLMTLMM